MKLLSNSNLLELFTKGQYQAVLEKTYNQGLKIETKHMPSVIGSLCFLGRTLEAEKAYQSSQRKLSATEKSMSLFFLSVAMTRQSRYDEAWARIEQIEKLSRKKSFYLNQAKSFYFFFQGRLHDCLQWAESALEAAIAAQDLYARSLATDILGHVQVRMGRIQLGLSLMNEASKLARRIQNKSVANAIELAEIQYRVQFGLDLPNAVAMLQERMEQIETEDSYTLSLLGLELARQLTLRGAYQAAEKTLKKISFQILSSENIRYELLLNLRLAELNFQRGNWIDCQHSLRSARRGLQAEGTSVFEIQILGLEMKLAKVLQLPLNLENLQERLFELSKSFPSVMNSNLLFRQGNPSYQKALEEDQIHRLFQLCSDHPQEASQAVLQSGLVTLLYDLHGLKRDESFLYWNEKENIYLFNARAGFLNLPQGLTPFSLQLLEALSFGEMTKSDLVERLWKFRYDPLRHDPMIYSAIRQLRMDLGELSSHIETTDEGYRLSPEIKLRRIAAEDSPRQKRPEIPSFSQDLNLRQLKALRLFERFESLNVEVYSKEMATQRLMASRDLRLLVEKGYIKRIGAGRATEYVLAKGPS